jgi:hypothetical protein
MNILFSLNQPPVNGHSCTLAHTEQVERSFVIPRCIVFPCPLFNIRDPRTNPILYRPPTSFSCFHHSFPGPLPLLNINNDLRFHCINVLCFSQNTTQDTYESVFCVYFPKKYVRNYGVSAFLGTIYLQMWFLCISQYSLYISWPF